MKTHVKNALKKKFNAYDGPYSDLADEIPRLYQFMVNLVNDRDLPDTSRPMIVGTLGILSMPGPILHEEDKNLLALAYLVASVVRDLDQRPEAERVVDRNWPGQSNVRDFLSDVIRRGNENLSRREIVRIYKHAGFEPRE